MLLYKAAVQWLAGLGEYWKCNITVATWTLALCLLTSRHSGVVHTCTYQAKHSYQCYNNYYMCIIRFINSYTHIHITHIPVDTHQSNLLHLKLTDKIQPTCDKSNNSYNITINSSQDHCCHQPMVGCCNRNYH